MNTFAYAVGLLAGGMTKEAVGARSMRNARWLNRAAGSSLPGARAVDPRADKALARQISSYMGGKTKLMPEGFDPHTLPAAASSVNPHLGVEVAAWNPAAVERFVPRQYQNDVLRQYQLRQRAREFGAPPQASKPVEHFTDRLGKNVEALNADADRLALSGRHAKEVMPMPVEGQQLPKLQGTPDEVYRGWEHTPRHGVPGIPGKPRDHRTGTWFTAHPEVAAGYVKGPEGYVMKADHADLAKFGPHSPGFHPHLAVDTRGMTPWQVHKTEYGGTAGGLLAKLRGLFGEVPRRSLAGANPGWARDPHYERVYTHPSRSGHDLEPMEYARELYKKLPSGTGLQRIFQKTSAFSLAGLRPALAGLFRHRADVGRKASLHFYRANRAKFMPAEEDAFRAAFGRTPGPTEDLHASLFNVRQTGRAVPEELAAFDALKQEGLGRLSAAAQAHGRTASNLHLAKQVGAGGAAGGLGLAGYAGWKGLAGNKPSQQPQPQAPPEPEPFTPTYNAPVQAERPLTARAATRKNLTANATSAVKNWWQRINKRPGEVPR
jgi:hypothetical protein